MFKKVFELCKKNSAAFGVAGLTGFSTFFSKKLPLDLKDEIEYGERGRGVTYGYTATGSPVAFPIGKEKEEEFQKKWKEEQKQEIRGCKRCKR